LTDTKESTTLLGISWWGNVTKKTRRMVLEMQGEVKHLCNSNGLKEKELFL
jgi:hypothetical protein